MRTKRDGQPETGKTRYSDDLGSNVARQKRWYEPEGLMTAIQNAGKKASRFHSHLGPDHPFSFRLGIVFSFFSMSSMSA